MALRDLAADKIELDGFSNGDNKNPGPSLTFVRCVDNVFLHESETKNSQNCRFFLFGHSEAQNRRPWYQQHSCINDGRRDSVDLNSEYGNTLPALHTCRRLPSIRYRPTTEYEQEEEGDAPGSVQDVQRP
jgi:hypothetical protein